MRKYFLGGLTLTVLAMVAFMAQPAQAATVGFVSRPSEAADFKGDSSGIGRFNRNEANKNLVKVHGKVTAVSETSITIMSKMDTENSSTVEVATSYTFDIDSTTKVIRRFRGASSVAEVSIGDHVRVWGTALTDGTAKLIWDKSIWWLRLTGTTSNMNAATNTFNLLITRPASDSSTKTFSVKVKTNAMTIYTMADGSAGTWSDLANGEVVRVRGVWNHVGRYLTARNIKLIE